MIEIGKQYQLGKGWEVRLFAVDGGGMLPVLGAYFHPNGHWQPDRWTAEGKSRPMGEGFDLVEVRPRHKRTVWINMYPKDNSDRFYTTLKCALSRRGSYCIATVSHTFDFAEGDGL